MTERDERGAAYGVNEARGLVATPLLLTPLSIQKMIDLRQKAQVVKFRTTCADCLPNY